MARAPRNRREDAERQADYREAQKMKGVPEGRVVAMAAFRQFVLICHRQGLTRPIDEIEKAVIRDLYGTPWGRGLTEAGISDRFEAMVDEFIRNRHAYP